MNLASYKSLFSTVIGRLSFPVLGWFFDFLFTRSSTRPSVRVSFACVWYLKVSCFVLIIFSQLRALMCFQTSYLFIYYHFWVPCTYFCMFCVIAPSFRHYSILKIQRPTVMLLGAQFVKNIQRFLALILAVKPSSSRAVELILCSLQLSIVSLHFVLLSVFGDEFSKIQTPFFLSFFLFLLFIHSIKGI